MVAVVSSVTASNAIFSPSRIGTPFGAARLRRRHKGRLYHVGRASHERPRIPVTGVVRRKRRPFREGARASAQGPTLLLGEQIGEHGGKASAGKPHQIVHGGGGN